jgi:hypothetical protein
MKSWGRIPRNRLGDFILNQIIRKWVHTVITIVIRRARHYDMIEPQRNSEPMKIPVLMKE